MWSLFQHHQSSDTALEQPLLSDQELQGLRVSAEHLDCSATLSQTLTSREAGWLPSTPIGSGMDYAESRVYQQGDDPRYIDWRLSARSHETFVKTYHIESRPSLCIVLDKRSSMVFGTRSRLKITQALRCAVLLAYAAEFHQIDFNVLILEDDVKWFDHLNTASFLLHANTACEADKQSEKRSEPSLKSALNEIKLHLPKGSLVYVISDFLDLVSGLTKDTQNELAHLQEQYVVQAIHIMDSAEIELPNVGKIRLQGMNTNQHFSLNTKNEKEIKSFITYARQHSDNIKNAIADIGISYSRIFTHHDDIHKQISLPLSKRFKA